MCGISGFFQQNLNRVSQEQLIDMTDSLSHRGPDAAGHYYNNFIGLGHRR